MGAGYGCLGRSRRVDAASGAEKGGVVEEECPKVTIDSIVADWGRFGQSRREVCDLCLVTREAARAMDVGC